MATNPKALELAKQGKVEYDWGTLWPHYHKEKMNWGGGFKTKGDVDILFLAGETGRDPFEDSPCRTPEEERAGKGKVVSGDVKQQTRQCLEYIKNKLEMMDASLKHIVMFRYYLPRREDVFDMRDEMYRFFETYDLLLTPTTPTVAFDLTLPAPRTIAGVPVVGGNPSYSFTSPFNMTGSPAASIPAGWTDDGLPIGLQIVGGHLADQTVLRASAAFERAAPWADRHPPV